MSEQPDDSEPLTIEITVDASRFTCALQNAHSALVFATHPDLNGPLRPGEETTP